MSDYDVAIIGAGPAGSVAALVLARAGLDVVMIGAAAERSSYPTRGETLSPTAAPVLARLQLTSRIDLHRMPRVTGFVSRWGSTRTVERPGFAVPDAGTFSLDRPNFDDALRRAAAECGATTLVDRVSAVMSDGRRWRVTIWRGGHVDARFVIDASGRGARFARRAGVRLLAFDSLIAITGVLKPTPQDRDRSVIVESAPAGWLFTTLDAFGSRVVSFFTDRDLWPASELRRPDRLLDRMLGHSQDLAACSERDRLLRTRIWPAGTLVLARAGIPGLLAVGDAAQTRDPLSSQGISAAMEDAESAASLLSANFRDPLSAIDLHERRRRQRVIQYLRDRRLYYRAETRWPEQVFWRRRHDLGS